MTLPLLLLLPLALAVSARPIGAKRPALRIPLLRLSTMVIFALALYQFILVCRGRALALSAPALCGLSLTFRADGYRALYALVAAFMWMMSALLSGRYFAHGENMGRYCFYTLITAFATLGVLLSDDLITAFIFLEMLSFASFPWVMHEENPGAMRAGGTYLGIAVVCGMISLMGLMLLSVKIDDFSYAALANLRGRNDLVLPAALCMTGFAAKAGLFPLHVWLPRAHAVSPAPASALLSGVLTKAGLFGVIVIARNLMNGILGAGATLLLLALITMLLGAVLAVFSTNLKRTLACSSVSQIGYIMTGVACMVLTGGENALAGAGAAAHMLNHSLLKLVLFTAAGVIYMNAHTLSLSALRGFGRGKPLLNAAFLLGAMGLAGIPGLNGYVSKTLLHEGLKETIAEINLHAGLGFSWWNITEYVFLFAAGLTTAYMLKLYICLFVQKNPDAAVQQKYDALHRRYMDIPSAIALLVPAALLPALGLFSGQTLLRGASMFASFAGVAPIQHAVALFSVENLLGGGVTLVIGTLVYVLYVRRRLITQGAGYIDRWPDWLDLEGRVYRPLVCEWIPLALGAVSGFLDKLPSGKLVTFYIPRAYNALFGWLDDLPASRLITVYIPRAYTVLMRAFDELTDHLALLIRELLFASRGEVRAARGDSVFIRFACVILDGLYALKARLTPGKLDDRAPDDLRYGSALTNAVSFGLLLAAAALLAAMLFVFSRAH